MTANADYARRVARGRRLVRRLMQIEEELGRLALDVGLADIDAFARDVGWRKVALTQAALASRGLLKRHRDPRRRAARSPDGGRAESAA